MPILLRGVEGIQAYTGFDLGKSSWVEIDQGMVNSFASTTDDWDWLCVDEDRAKIGPFGRTVAQSYLILSLVTPMLRDIYLLEGIGYSSHHGLNRLRFPAPVPVNSSVRLDATLRSVEPVTEGVELVLECAMECDGTSAPVLLAEIIYRVWPEDCAEAGSAIPG
ncbi:MAG: MaoC/PaaZ C-terminal domain-containing protein [Paraburkholderia sp.]|uniref:MaoC/PaaZ C-terminal domain-containing protein n=1 Tax=Paraburkholderia sp. TaxID=1926495 RepID=UPI003C3469DB